MYRGEYRRPLPLFLAQHCLQGGCRGCVCGRMWERYECGVQYQRAGASVLPVVPPMVALRVHAKLPV